MGKKVMIFAGVTTLLQAVIQVIFSSVSLAQYFCLIDFFRELPILLFIKILYLHNPSQCGIRINIGNAIDGMANQAFILMTTEPLTVTRTFLINCVSLGLGALWLLTSAILMTGGAKNNHSKPIRWPWIIVSVAVCALDVVATVIFANDSFYTRTLNDMLDYIGATGSGTGSIQLDTSYVAWIMVILYSRFAFFFLFNVLLIVLVILDRGGHIKSDVVTVENASFSQPLPALVTQVTTQDAEVQSSPINTHSQVTLQDGTDCNSVTVSEQLATETMQQNQRSMVVNSSALSNITEASRSTRETEDGSTRENESPKIPRAGFNRAFRSWKKLLFAKETPTPRRFSVTESLDLSPEKSPRTHHVNDKKRTVNFPENLLSLPQRLENMIAEQQRRLDTAVVDTAGRASPPRATQSLPQLHSNETTQTAMPIFNKERRGTAAELQGQLPWAYIPASAHRMRDQLPPDEDLPPVPLPDYTAIPTFRKASVHRAASSVSSLTQKRNYFISQSSKTPLTQSDVLY
ncbi:unnamed protein product, partial [Brenthis ino]